MTTRYGGEDEATLSVDYDGGLQAAADDGRVAVFHGPEGRPAAPTNPPEVDSPFLGLFKRGEPGGTPAHPRNGRDEAGWWTGTDPSGLPTIPPGVIPSASGTCPYVTVEEVNAAFGSTATLTNSDGDCTFTFSNFSTVVVSIEEGSDLSTSKMLLGDTAKDLNVGGFPAVSGVFIGQPLVHVQKGANQMQVLGVLTGSDDATIAKLVQIATIAVGRWPG